MDRNEFKIIAGVLHMIIQSDEFHLLVAKALLSEEPLSERQKVALRDLLAKRERNHEQMEAALESMKKILNG